MCRKIKPLIWSLALILCVSFGPSGEGNSRITYEKPWSKAQGDSAGEARPDSLIVGTWYDEGSFQTDGKPETRILRFRKDGTFFTTGFCGARTIFNTQGRYSIKGDTISYRDINWPSNVISFVGNDILYLQPEKGKLGMAYTRMKTTPHKRDLVGSWEVESGDVKHVITFARDGSHQRFILSKKAGQSVRSGTYQLGETILSLKEQPNDQVGSIDWIDGDRFLFQLNGQRNTGLVFHRMRPATPRFEGGK